MAHGADNMDGADVSEDLGALLDALVSLTDRSSAYGLMQDLCTPRELEDLSSRLQVARMLDAGVSYVRIQAATGVSATTVARVARCLKYGPGGYRAVLQKLGPLEPEGDASPASSASGDARA